MKREQIISYFFIGLFIFIVYELFRLFSPFLHAIFWAAILAFAFYPLYRNILDRLRRKRTLAALLTTLIILLVVTPPMVMILFSLTEEAVELYQKVSTYLSSGELDLFFENVKTTASTEWARQLWARLEPFRQNMVDALLAFTKKMGNLTAKQIVSISKNILLLFFNFFLIIFLLFFFLRDGEQIHRFIYDLIPMEQKNKKTLAGKMNETFSAVIRGQLVTSIVQGTLAGLTFWALRLPVPLLVGFLTFLTSMIPVTGAATVWGPFAAYLFLANETTKAGILSVVGVFLISLSDNFLKPLLIGEKTKLPVFLLFLGMLGGLKIYGLTGIFLGPVLLSLFFVLVKIYHEEYQPGS